MNKGDQIVKKALERYRPAATEKVLQVLCASCPDRRCEAGIRCNAYALLVEASAWEMASGENNEMREGGDFD